VLQYVLSLLITVQGRFYRFPTLIPVVVSLFLEVLFLGAGQIILSVFHILLAISLIVIVLLQSGKSAGLSGSIAGGAETFFGKNKGRTIDAMLSKYTAFAAIAFLVTSIVLYIVIKA
jgi:preprotein translocase subunit SecG